MKRHSIGILNGIIAAASYGTNPLFALPLFNAGIGVNSVLFYRYFFALIIYGLWLKFYKKANFKLSKNEILPLFILSMFFSFSSLTLFEAFRYIASGIACTILFIYPVIVALIMRLFFKEKLPKIIILAILLVIGGIILLYNGDGEETINIKGVLIVLLSALLYALYIVCTKKIKTIRHIKTDKLSFYVMLFGLSVYIYNLKFHSALQILNKPVLWVYAILLSIIPTIISLETITIAIRLTGPVKTAILGALEPLTAVFFGVIFFNEPLTLKIITGIILILSGVFAVILNGNKQTKQVY